MSNIKNDLMDKVERGDYVYNPAAREYQAVNRLTRFYTVVVEGMDIGLRFANQVDALERANSFGVDAHVGIVNE
jgi:hypothetical protein